MASLMPGTGLGHWYTPDHRKLLGRVVRRSQQRLVEALLDFYHAKNSVGIRFGCAHVEFPRLLSLCALRLYA